MNPLGQAALLFTVCVAGELLSVLTGGLLPGNVLGMILLLVLLLAGLLKVQKVEQAADFFLNHMAFFFLPSTLGIIPIYDKVQSELLKLLLVIVITTFLTAVCAGWTVLFVRRMQRKGDSE